MSVRLLRKPPARVVSLLAAALMSVSWCVSCIGGTGTDTENGFTDNKAERSPLAGHSGTAARVVDGDGKPRQGVELILHSPGFRGDSSAAEDRILASAQSMVSDSDGYVRFHLAAPGKYVAEGRQDGASLFFDTLAVADVKVLAAYTFRIRPATAARGRVRLASGLRIDSGTVFVRGTARFARLAADGAYDLGSLPADVGQLRIGLAYRASVREARVAEQLKPVPGQDTGKITVPARDTAKPVFRCREVSVDSAARLGSPATFASTREGMVPMFSTQDTVKLDTAKVAAVDRSCDSLESGTVVAVRTPQNQESQLLPKDTLTTNLIAVDAGAATARLPGAALNQGADPTLVPLSGCVASPGTTQTSFEVQLSPTATGNDLFVGDVAEKCLR